MFRILSSLFCVEGVESSDLFFPLMIIDVVNSSMSAGSFSSRIPLFAFLYIFVFSLFSPSTTSLLLYILFLNLVDSCMAAARAACDVMHERLAPFKKTKPDASWEEVREREGERIVASLFLLFLPLLILS